METETKEDELNQSLLEQEEGRERERLINKYMKHKNTFENAGFFNKLVFHWVTPTLKLGNKIPLEQEMLDDLRKQDKSKQLFKQFDRFWDIYKDTSKSPLYRAMFSFQRCQIFICLFLQFINAALDLAKPVMIQHIIAYSGSENKTLTFSLLWIFGMLLIQMLQNLFSLHGDFQFNILGYCLNNSIVIAIFKKSLNISLFSNKKYKSGEIINLSQVDANRLYQLFNVVGSAIFLPIQLAVGLWLMYGLIGVSLIVGFIAIAFIGVINFFITKKQVKLQKQLLKDKDGRMKVTNEIFGQIKFVKVNAWEEFFFKKLDIKRERELKTLGKKLVLTSCQTLVGWITSPLIYNSVFLWYTLTNHILKPEQAFPVIALFNTLQSPIQGIPNIISAIIETHLSVTRLQKYFKTEEIDISYIQTTKKDDDQSTGLELKNGTFNWGPPIKSDEDKELQDKKEAAEEKQQKKEEKKREKELKKLSKKEKNQTKKEYESINRRASDDQELLGETRELDTIDLESQNPSILPRGQDLNVLQDININIPNGKMVAIIGDVGSGKSSFLYSLLGEMKYDHELAMDQAPSCLLNGSISLVNQKPWVMSDTIQNNITFGKEYDQKKYDETILYACLSHDFKVLTNGDQTMIGEKGVNLSGGQKARVALARALYANTDILLLDDILSAVDVHVGKFIIKECLMKYKLNTTRVLITHALYYVKYMDYIYLMDDGQIITEGTYEQLRNSPRFTEIYDKFMKDQYKEHKEDLDELQNENDDFEDLTKPEDENSDNEEEDLLNLENKLEKKQSSLKLQKKQSSLKLQKKQSSKKEEAVKVPGQKDKIDDLIMAEDRQKGDLGMKVYWAYAKYNGGVFFLITIVFFACLSQALRMFSSIWMSWWTDKADKPDFTQEQNIYYMKWYAITSLSVSFGAFIRVSTVLTFNFQTIRKIHRGMIKTLLYAPLNEFFDRVPLGRIVNRLSKDLTMMDIMLPFAVGAFLVGTTTALGTIILCVYSSTPYVIIPIVFYFILCVYVYKFYMNGNREIVRLENITKSPVVGHLAETLNGLHSIRAYNRQVDFINQQCKHVNENKKNQILQQGTAAWFRIVLSMFSIVINGTSISYCIFQDQDPALTGLLMTYALTLDMAIRWAITNLSWLESRLVSFERCNAFLDIDSEPGYHDFLEKREELLEKITDISQLHNKNPALKHWPAEGHVQFKNVHARYRKKLDTVIKGITFEVKPSEKIGIVGRTGAGKSTITLCLLRILELAEGSITIDGVDISTLSLDELRSKITIILQDPSLFEGTLKENMDPLNERTDVEIKETLVKCNMEKFMNDREGLDTQISDGGGNLSVGEKQLICIGRALLKKSKLILVDEATANIDIQTESMLQQTISEVFKDCTVLTIAHRINTILRSDRILVLSTGKVEEFDSPKTLLQNPNSLFYNLHEEALKENKI